MSIQILTIENQSELELLSDALAAFQCNTSEEHNTKMKMLEKIEDEPMFSIFHIDNDTLLSMGYDGNFDDQQLKTIANEVERSFIDNNIEYIVEKIGESGELE